MDKFIFYKMMDKAFKKILNLSNINIKSKSFLEKYLEPSIINVLFYEKSVYLNQDGLCDPCTWLMIIPLLDEDIGDKIVNILEEFLYSLSSIEKEFLLNFTTSIGCTCLTFCVKYSHKSFCYKCLKVMLQHGANVNIRDNNGVSILSITENEKTIKLLLRYGAKF